MRSAENGVSTNDNVDEMVDKITENMTESFKLACPETFPNKRAHFVCSKNIREK